VRRTCTWWATCHCCTRRIRCSRRCSTGWRSQQLARNLAYTTVEERECTVRVFAAHADAHPWAWMPQLVDEWFTDLRAIRHCAKSTVRGYQIAIRGFCNYITDPAYGWVCCTSR
jgi:hypothetical protein